MSADYTSFSASESDQGHQIADHAPIDSARTPFLRAAIEAARAAGGSITLNDDDGCPVRVDLHEPPFRVEADVEQNGHRVAANAPEFLGDCYGWQTEDEGQARAAAQSLQADAADYDMPQSIVYSVMQGARTLYRAA